MLSIYFPHGPSTQYLEVFGTKTMKGIVFGTRNLKYWVYLDPLGLEPQGQLDAYTARKLPGTNPACWPVQKEVPQAPE